VKPRDENKIQQIFSATLHLVKEHGLAGITMSEIAGAAKIATGTLYIYFKSKDELINALYTNCRKAAVSMYFKDYDDKLPFKVGLKIIWLNLLRYRMKHFRETVFTEQYYHSPFIAETTKEITQKMFQPFYKLIERGKNEKLLKDIDSFILLVFMVSGINEFVKHSIYRGTKITEPLMEQMFNLCWDGMRA
jgi:AcrR family transcriptional regulator